MTQDTERLKILLEELCQEDLSMVEMAERAQISRSLMYYYLGQFGLTPYRKKAREDIISSVKSPVNADAVEILAQEHDMSKSKIRRLLKSHNLLESSDAPFYQKIDRRKLFHLYVTQDMSMHAIAKAHGYSSASPVKTALEYYNIPVRPRGTAKNNEERQLWRARAMIAEDSG